MAKVDPFYSSQQRDVYHDNDRCTEGNNIEPKYKTSGTGGLPKCNRCKSL
jgi:phenylacetate-coenzyme A ligase PaaK-like adenylate-forming protein